MKNLITNGFAKLEMPALLELGNTHDSQMLANTETFAIPTPSNAAYRDLLDELTAANQDAQSKDIFKVAILEEKRLTFVGVLQLRGVYVNMIANGNMAIAILSALPTRKPSTPRVMAQMDAPKVKLGKHRGEVRGRTPAQKGYKSCIWYITEDINLPLAQWTSSKGENCSMVFENLEAGKTYYICVRMDGVRDQWFLSPISSIVAY